MKRYIRTSSDVDLEFEVDGEVYQLPSSYANEDEETVEHEKEVLSAAIRRGEDISDIYEERFTGFSSVRNRIYREMKYEGYSDDAIERAIKRAMDALHKSL